MALPSSAFYGPAEIDYMKLVPNWFYDAPDVDPIASFTDANKLELARQEVDKRREAEELEQQLSEMMQQKAEQGPIDFTSPEIFDEVEGMIAQQGDVDKWIQFRNSRPKPPSIQDQVSLAAKFEKMGAIPQAEEILSQVGFDVDLPGRPAKGSGGKGNQYIVGYNRTTGEQGAFPKPKTAEEMNQFLKSYSTTKPKIEDESVTGKAEKLLKKLQSIDESLMSADESSTPFYEAQKAQYINELKALRNQATPEASPQASATPANPDAPPPSKAQIIRQRALELQAQSRGR